MSVCAQFLDALEDVPAILVPISHLHMVAHGDSSEWLLELKLHREDFARSRAIELQRRITDRHDLADWSLPNCGSARGLLRRKGLEEVRTGGET